MSVLTGKEEITFLRKRIDAIDAQIMKLLSERVNLSKEIGKTKGKSNKPILDAKREAVIYEKIEECSKELMMNPEDCVIVFKEIIRMCRNAQEDIKTKTA